MPLGDGFFLRATRSLAALDFVLWCNSYSFFEKIFHYKLLCKFLYLQCKAAFACPYRLKNRSQNGGLSLGNPPRCYPAQAPQTSLVS
jgi:hypothetical protein